MPFLEQYVNGHGLTDIKNIDIDEINPENAKRFAFRLWQMCWQIIEDAEEDRLMVEDELLNEFVEVVSVFPQLISKGSTLEVLENSGMTAEDAIDGWLRVLRMNQLVQEGMDVRLAIESSADYKHPSRTDES